MNQKELSASAAGDVLRGGEIFVHRLGFGAMRLTGEGIWGPPKDRTEALAVLRRASPAGRDSLRRTCYYAVASVLGTNKTCERASIARTYGRQVCGFGNQLANNCRQAQNLPPEHGGSLPEIGD
jgi:hypothetical protein